MGSYTDVKNLIISNIKANGQREITGPILQDVLLNMLENSSRVEEITYSDLKALRDGAKLTPSRLYRITDYITTTVQSNTKSARHPFDVIVLALSESELLEQAWAIQHEGDEYFTNSNLSDWELWYCLDNDTTRFAWADSTNGKGVIYRMIDEFGNDCPYDFKNIQFYRQWNEAKQLWSTTSNGAVGVPCYTFSSKGDSSATEFTDTTLMLDRQVYDNSIKAGTLSNQVLNNNCFFGDGCYGNTFESSCSYNTFGNDCNYNTFGSNCWNNTFGSNCNYNTFGSNCNYNSFGSNCWNNTFESSCVDNIFYGDCLKNSFGISCQRNTFGSSCRNNTFYGNCWNNIFESSCLGNTFESSCDDNFFGENCNYNTFGSNCKGNSLGISCQGNSLGNNCQNNSFGSNCWNNTFGNVCYYIKFASDKSASTKYNYYRNNHFGDGCQYVLFKCAETASASAQVQNYKFAQGLQGTSDEYLAIDGKRNRSYETYISRDTDGTIKESVIAEFENRLGNCVDLTTEQTINAAKTFSAGIDLNGTIISKVGSPINADDATNKEYVDDTVKTVDDKVNDFKNAGYLYAGIATSLTNPGTPDTKVFYIANGKGVYTNFGGLEVTEDDVVILYWDSSWHKVATGIAPQEKLSELDTEVRHIERDLGMYSNTTEYVLAVGVSGKYIDKDSGLEVANSNYSISQPFSLKAGDILLVPSASAVTAACSVVSKKVTNTYDKVIIYAYTYDEFGRINTATADYNPSLVYTAYYESDEQTTPTDWMIGGEHIAELPQTHEVTESFYEPLVKQSVAGMPDTGYYVYLASQAMDVVVSAYNATINGGHAIIAGWGIFKNIATNFVGIDKQRVIAEAIADLFAQVEGINEKLTNGLDRLSVKHLHIDRELSGLNIAGTFCLQGAGVPSASVVPVNWDFGRYGDWKGIPQFIGQEYFDTIDKVFYKAHGVNAVSDWKRITNA